MWWIPSRPSFNCWSNFFGALVWMNQCRATDKACSIGMLQENKGLATLVVGGRLRVDGGKICGGGGRGGSHGGDGGFGFSDSNHENTRTDVYYQTMIEANPSNDLILGIYARVMKEVIIRFKFILTLSFR
ncbi:hypothetical protein NE237_000212 [Protea cynaroides]|uniref:Uncharacterized protein n=1 Tax=Protea cynaroides TaxID=273540 RepID=A0A9Q0KRL8_9MAGN|nr:hypothetical protein NE237_000212 [Protea cynaroides]